MSEKPTKQISQMQMFSAEDFPAKTSRWLEDVQGWMETKAVYSMSSIELLQKSSRNGWLSRMSPVFCTPMEEETLQSFLEDLPESFQKFLKEAGEIQDSQQAHSTKSPIVSLTLSISEFPSAAAESSLLDILETDVPQKYYLTARACQGLLKRGLERGNLPPLLQRLLQMQAELIEWQGKKTN